MIGQNYNSRLRNDKKIEKMSNLPGPCDRTDDKVWLRAVLISTRLLLRQLVRILTVERWRP